MPILEQLQNHFPSYVWRHVLSMLVGLMLLREAKTLTVKCQESLPTLSRTLNVYAGQILRHLKRRWGQATLGAAGPLDSVKDL